MSAKSVLTIYLEEQTSRERLQEDLVQLKLLVGAQALLRKYFSGWTYWAQIGNVYLPATFEKLFDALDSAVDAFLPIIYKFRGIKFLNNSIFAFYYPDDMDILLSFRNHMTSNGISFVDNSREPFFAIEIDLGNIDQLENRTRVEGFVPKQPEIQFFSASIQRATRHRTRLYHRATANKSQQNQANPSLHRIANKPGSR